MNTDGSNLSGLQARPHREAALTREVAERMAALADRGGYRVAPEVACLAGRPDLAAPLPAVRSATGSDTRLPSRASAAGERRPRLAAYRARHDSARPEYRRRRAAELAAAAAESLAACRR